VSLLQQNRYDQLLRRVGDLKGQGSKVADVLAELFPMFDVESDRGELQILSGTDICVGATTVGPSAGNSPRIQVFNPVGSGKIATVTTVYPTTPNTGIVRMATATIALTTGIGTEVFRDRRRAVTQRPTCQMRTDLTAALTDGNWLFRQLASNSELIHDDNGVAVLAPGTGLEVGHGSLNTTLLCSFMWRERVAEPSELSF